MKMSDMGEEGFIQMLKKMFPSNDIGDDCAILPLKDSKNVWLLTTDALIEGNHFLNSTISPENLGYKSVMVNVSDIAAMGGKPLYALLSLGIPSSTDKSFLDAFLHGLKKALKENDLILIGGDTISSPQMFINLTVIGEELQENVKRRDGGEAGDIVCVDGYLGDSAAGLHLLLHSSNEKSPASLIEAHQRPRAHVPEGLWLACQPEVHAMMDISDGLYTDLSRLINASKKGCRIDLERLPLSSDFFEYCKDAKLDPLCTALEGGEEYCLLFTVAKKNVLPLNEAFKKQFGRNFWPIGELTSKPQKALYYLNGSPQSIQLRPFEHFRK